MKQDGDFGKLQEKMGGNFSTWFWSSVEAPYHHHNYASFFDMHHHSKIRTKGIWWYFIKKKENDFSVDWLHAYSEWGFIIW